MEDKIKELKVEVGNIQMNLRITSVRIRRMNEGILTLQEERKKMGEEFQELKKKGMVILEQIVKEGKPNVG